MYIEEILGSLQEFWKGCGWEARCNTLEITQITYFTTLCGYKFDTPFPLEIAYGVDRIALIFQSCDGIFNLMWSPSLTYKDMFGEYRLYNLETVEEMHRYLEKCTQSLRYKEFEQAYTYLLYASNSFNLLCASGILDGSAQRSIRGTLSNNATMIIRAYTNSRREG